MTSTPWSYVLIRLLFRFVLKIFYGTIVIENPHNVPPTGKPTIVCANHSNSLTDALLLVTSIPSHRNMLRLTAKATQFGHKTFTSWLIESAGTVPIKRRKDYDPDSDVDNSDAMEKLHQALEEGDAVCLFPEGMSRYHPTIAPLRTGVARMVSDILSRNRHDPDFEISVLPCSITYMHRQHFRSDVLVTFHPPMTFTPRNNPELLKPIEFTDIRALTNRLHTELSSGTYDSPSWSLIRTSKLAARIYAPLGTQMTLGSFVRISRAFLELFKAHQTRTEENDASFDQVSKLEKDLKAYQDQLSKYGIKDDRIRRHTNPLKHPHRLTLLSRMMLRLIWSLLLLLISLPGLLLWLPIFLTTLYAVHNFKKTGPIFDTYDEIAQYKLIYGLMSGLVVWAGGVLLTWPIGAVTVFLIPAVMWMALRWIEDAVSAVRALVALGRLLFIGKTQLKKMGEQRKELHGRVMDVAVGMLGLADDPEVFFTNWSLGSSGSEDAPLAVDKKRRKGEEKGRVKGSWDSGRRYFSVRRRRKRDWNETLRLYDKVDYPDEDW